MKSAPSFLAGLVLLLAGTSQVCPQSTRITLDSLLREMADRDAPARFPEPAYRQLQASTYNRASVARDQSDQTTSGWFADSDGVFSLRKETNAITQGVEYVLMDHTGPGAITKLWTPFFYYDYNIRTGPRIAIYLDGSPTPVLRENLIEWVTRLEWSTAEYGPKPTARNSVSVPAPLAGFTARAGNAYLPIPFAQSCKVTLEGPPFYDIISYRAYAEGTPVETFTLAAYQAATNQARLALTAQQLAAPPNFGGGRLFETNRSLARQESMTLALGSGPAAVRHLEIQLDPAQIAANPAALRSLVLVGVCDGEETLWCPVGDFFCSGNRLNALATWTRSVQVEAGLLVCRWVMPYQAQASVVLTNLGSTAVKARLAVRTDAWNWDDRSMHFHAGWRPDHVQVGSQFVDWNFVDVRGRGVLVGDAWTVLNRTAGWWGEGDEKIYVDDDYEGRRFPSHFGTGTEDYYGWAGGVNPTRADVFFSPYLANVLVGSTNVNGPLGFNISTRIRALDAIPFQERLVFDMEASPGVDQRNDFDLLMYSAVTFWYARPGATSNRGPRPAEAALPITSLEELNRRSDLLRSGGALVIPGAIEAERLIPVRQEGVQAVAQTPTAGWGGAPTLARVGLPVHSALVPAGGSQLSMSFDGNSSYAATELPLDLDFADCTISCDVRPTSLGPFDFVFAIGRNLGGGGGLAILQQGGFWGIIHQGQTAAYGNFRVVLNRWTHLELRRKDYGHGVETRLYVDGTQATAIASTPARFEPFVTVGANRLQDGSFEGHFNGQIDNLTLLGPVTPFSAFVARNFPDQQSRSVVGPAADPDRDGLANVFEFLYGSDPTDPHSTKPIGTARVQDHGGVQRLRYELPMDPVARQQVFWAVQVSTDLSHWEYIADRGLDTGALDQPVVVLDPLDAHEFPRRFMRLAIP